MLKLRMHFSNESYKMKVFFFCLLLTLPFYLDAQISRGGEPFPFKKGVSKKAAYFLHGDDEEEIHKLLLEDEGESNGLKGFRFARKIETSLNPLNSGEWQHFDDIRVWRLELYAENTYGLSIFFEKYKLQEGVSLFIYDPSQENILGSFNFLNNKQSGKLPTGFIPGNRLVVELQVPDNKVYGDLEIGYVSSAYKDIFGTKDGRFGLSGSCNADINCNASELWQLNKRAVCRILIASSSEFCTGTLMNNSRNDKRPLILTASHCISDKTKSESSIFYFGYEAPACNGVDGDVSMSISSARFLASNDSIDFAILELSDNIPWTYNPYYAGWNLSATPPESSVTIHHPEGDVKKISMDYDPLLKSYQTSGAPSWLYANVFPSAFWRVERWDIGTTEGGSSGAPLFDPSGLVIGNLTGGEATCARPVNDYFSKLSYGWDHYRDSARQIKHWLDPEGYASFLKGYDPFNEDIKPKFPVLFELYPNPNNGLFTIETDTLSLLNCRIRIYSSQGTLLGNYMPDNDRIAYFDLHTFPSGAYIIELNFSNRIIRKKFIIVK